MEQSLIIEEVHTQTTSIRQNTIDGFVARPPLQVAFVEFEQLQVQRLAMLPLTYQPPTFCGKRL